jgi:hypothetical protein
LIAIPLNTVLLRWELFLSNPTQLFYWNKTPWTLESKEV